MMFREIVTLICTQTGFTLGVDLYAGHRPQDAPDRCVLIAESGGATHPAEADMTDPLIQALARADTYFEARADSWTVYNAIHSTFGWNLPNLSGSGEDYLAMSVYALAIPQYLGQDENRRYEFSTNYIFRMEQASCGL